MVKSGETIFNKRYRTHYKIFSDLDTFGSDSVFSLIKFALEVKVTTIFLLYK